MYAPVAVYPASSRIIAEHKALALSLQSLMGVFIFGIQLVTYFRLECKWYNFLVIVGLAELEGKTSVNVSCPSIIPYRWSYALSRCYLCLVLGLTIHEWFLWHGVLARKSSGDEDFLGLCVMLWGVRGGYSVWLFPIYVTLVLPCILARLSSSRSSRMFYTFASGFEVCLYDFRPNYGGSLFSSPYLYLLYIVYYLKPFDSKLSINERTF